jgi:hypothetical protein
MLAGWQINGIVTLRTGFPGDIATAVPTFLSRNIGIKIARPDLVAGANNNPIGGQSSGCTLGAGSNTRTIPAGASLGTPNLYFDPCAFTTAPANTLGNLGRNTLTLPGLANFDFSLAKDFKITENSRLQFRSEFFNLFNRPNFDAPVLQVFNSSGAPGATAGRITKTVSTSRQIQFGLRYEF